MRILCAITLLLLSQGVLAQHQFRAEVKDSHSSQPLPGATAQVLGTSLGASADANGLLVIDNIPDGDHTIEIRFVGYETQQLPFTFPLPAGPAIQISLDPSDEELEEIIVASTRSSRTIADIPTRVEFIAGEELEEKGNMKPGDIRMLLNESTGIQTQQTSATSANASIRIQGLDGRYTQILKDGFPLYAGFSGGLGLLQTPPLDLKQVEVIKGSSSTLYGGGAIAGLVNLVSKRPGDERELRLFANGTSAKGLDLSTYYSEQLKGVGITLFASRNSSEPYDPADIGLSAIPAYTRYSVNPKLFFGFGDNDKLEVGVSATTEERIGGDMLYLDGKGDAVHSYFEKNDSRRMSTQLVYQHRFDGKTELNVRNSFNVFDRDLSGPSYRFEGLQKASFTELNVVHNRGGSEWIGGANLWTDQFSEEQLTTTPVRDYSLTTLGGFLQNNIALSDRWRLESGLRGDYVVDYGFALLPRLSLMYSPSETFSSRLGGGLGYKAPTIFTEESERLQYRNVLPVSAAANELERSYGTNWDFNFRTSVANDAIGINVNQLFFYTYLDSPLMLNSLTSGDNVFSNLAGHIDTGGMETNVKVEYADFKLFLGYTYTDTQVHSGGMKQQNPLTAKHRLNNVLMYEKEESWKVGLEAYYFSQQRLGDGTLGKDYWIFGLMMEKIWERVSLYLNFENFTDTRQTRFDSIYTGSITNPMFRDIYAPVDGFVVNGGFKLTL
ncbi:MAG: TonB-dependent receptor [Cyclobacteriaceae bacterium]|nr:TonB-dependent receptor [Cyclobacteriaceae bacterium]